MRKPVVLVDICNTLANVNEQIDVVTGVSRPEGTYFHPAVRDESFFEGHMEVFSNARVLDGSIEFVNRLASTYEVLYFTARPECSYEITREWLRTNGFPVAPIIFTKDKVASCREMNVAFAVDDAPHEVMAYSRAGILCLVPAWDYNVTVPGRFVYRKGGVCHAGA